MTLHDSARVSALRTALATRVVVADGAMGTMLQAARPVAGRLRGLRGLQRGPQRRPGRTSCARCTTRTSPWASTPSRPTRSAPTSPTSASTASPTASRSSPRPAPGIAREVGRRLLDRRTGRAGSSARSARAPSCRPSATRRTPTLRDAYEAQARGLIAGGVDAVLVETAQDLLQAKSAVVGRQARDRAPRRRRAGDRPGDGRDHRHHAARHPRSAPRSPRSSRSAST